MLHCTYRRPDGCYLKLPHDYRTIAAYDVANAIAIRVCEQKTEDRIAWLRRNRGVPDDHLPPDDWLWLDESEVSPAAMVEYAGHARERTTLARTLSEQSPNSMRPSLIELGYAQFRYIARRSRYATPARVFTELHHDHEGKAFILVEDYQGYYLDEEGELHCSLEEGYTDVVKQYLYCFEVVNAKIAAIDGSTPPALPRWSPQQKMPLAGETHRNCNSSSLSGIKANAPTRGAISGGNRQSTSRVEASTNEDTTHNDDVSIRASSERTVGPSQAALRVAPWNAETILGLLARHLAVPPKPDENDAGAMDRYLIQWYDPALWMLHATNDLEPRRAWEMIERRVVGMLRGPTWYARRTTQAPITARNVVGPASAEKPLNGANWENVWKELDKAKWWADVMTPYDGPPLTMYEQGYKGEDTTTASEPSIIVEEPEELPRPAWMSREEAIALCYEIEDAYSPALRVALNSLGSDRWHTSMRWGPGADDWHDFHVPEDWRLPSPEVVDLIDQALHFAAQRDADATEVGAIEAAEEPPLIVLEPQDNDAPEETYVSMEELSEELQRGLRPLSSPLMAEVAPMVEKSPPMPVQPPGKTGMSLEIAMMLLTEMLHDYPTAELRPLDNQRALIRVEISPGTWLDVESGVAWQRHLKSVAQSPPHASVIAMAGMEQSMEVAQ